MKYFTLFIFFLFVQLTNAQPNLVPNGSFEDYDSCPFRGEGLNGEVKFWNDGVGGGGYFNSCANSFPSHNFPGYNEGVPKNVLGYQNARTGNAYVGLRFSEIYFLRFKSQLNYYLDIQLNSNCLARLKYKCTFYTSANGLSGIVYEASHLYGHTGDDSIMLCTTSSIGAYLGNTPLILDGSLHYLQAQIKNDPTLVLSDTINWMEIKGSFEANGTEKFMTIGTFEDSNNITYFNTYGYTKPHSGILGKQVFYFIDDVSLIPQNTTHYYDSILCSNAPLQLGAVAQADSFEWFDGNKTDKLRQFTQPGLVWVKSWLCGGTVYMWDSINIINQPISTGLPKDTFFCFNQPNLTLTATANDSYLWRDGSLVNSLLVDGVDLLSDKIKVWLTVTKNTCTLTDTVTITQKPAIQIPITDTTTCFEDVPQILLDAGAQFKTYLWQPTGETTKTVYSQQTQIYNLTVTDSFNCTQTKSIVVDELCKTEVFIPNAFTPNNDNLNDSFKPIFKTKNLIKYEFKIFDSWGNEVFTTTDTTKAWDAKNSSIGVYVVLVNYQYKSFFPQTQKGTVTLLR